MTSSPQLLIDGDLYLYAATASAEFEADMGDDVWYLTTNLEKAKDHWLATIDSFSRALNSEDIVVVLSGKHDFRRTLCPSYKGNRKGKRKPMGYAVLKDWLYEQYPGKVVANDLLEADDYLGLLASAPGAVERIIVSEDKDMLTVPCNLFRQGQLNTIDERLAETYWLTQTLTGDPADGYKGCPGVGAVKAASILSKPGSRWENVRQAFLKAGLDEEAAVLQARLARILRHGDWDTANKQVILWTPPKAAT